MTTIALAHKAHRSHNHHIDAVQLLITTCIVAAVITVLAMIRTGGGAGDVVPAGPQSVTPASLEVIREMDQPESVVVVEAQPEQVVSTPPASLQVLAEMNGD